MSAAAACAGFLARMASFGRPTPLDSCDLDRIQLGDSDVRHLHTAAGYPRGAGGGRGARAAARGGCGAALLQGSACRISPEIDRPDSKKFLDAQREAFCRAVEGLAPGLRELAERVWHDVERDFPARLKDLVEKNFDPVGDDVPVTGREILARQEAWRPDFSQAFDDAIAASLYSRTSFGNAVPVTVKKSRACHREEW